MPNTKKVAAVERIQKTLNENSNVAIIGFDKTKHTALEALRKSLRKTNATMTVSKSSLVEKAFEKGDSKFASFHKSAFPLKNNSAMVFFGGDWSASLKAIFDFAKKEVGVVFKAGFLDSVSYDKPTLEKLAQLPSKVELLGKVIGSLKSPIYRIDTAIKFPMTYLVNTLKARAQQAS